MDTNSRIDELKELLKEQGVDVASCEGQGAETRPSTKIAEAALEDLVYAGSAGTSGWGNWTKGIKQLSGDCEGGVSGSNVSRP